MKIGFTGTQQGMNDNQKYLFGNHLKDIKGEFHHGDCIGADAQAHEIAIRLGLEPVIHPPDIMRKRAFKTALQIRKSKPYLDRNKDIVNETELLVAAPKEMEMQLRSGTWSTIRYARKLKKNALILYPNGTWIKE